MKYVVEDIGEGRVAVYEFFDDTYTETPIVMSRREAYMEFDVVGELVDGEVSLFSPSDEDEDLDLVYYGVDEDDDEEE